MFLKLFIKVYQMHHEPELSGVCYLGPLPLRLQADRIRRKENAGCVHGIGVFGLPLFFQGVPAAVRYDAGGVSSLPGPKRSDLSHSAPQPSFQGALLLPAGEPYACREISEISDFMAHKRRQFFVGHKYCTKSLAENCLKS